MENNTTNDCPMPEPFSAKVGITVFLAWLFYLGFVTRVMFAPLMPAIEKDLSISHGQAGSLFLFISIGYLLAPLCSGLISSKINHRGTLCVSAWAVGIALIPISFSKSVWIVRFLLMVIGLAAGIHLPSAIATITAEIRKQDWGKALSVHQTAPPLSFISAPLIAAFFMNWFTWRIILLIWAFIAIISALVYTYKGKGGDFPGQLPNAQNVKLILSKSSFWIMVVLFAMAMGGNAGIYAMLPLYLVHDHSMDLKFANTLIGISQISGLVIVFLSGWITDRVGQKQIIVFTLLLTGLATIFIGMCKGSFLITAIFIQPALLNSFFPAAFAALSRIAPPSMRSVTNALGPPMSFLIGGGILPLVIARMGEAYSFGSGIVLVGGCMLISPVLVLILKLGQYDNEAGC